VDLFDQFEDAGAAGSVVACDGRLWHAAGASAVQELAAALGAYVACSACSIPAASNLARAAARIGIVLAADADEFLTVAKFRAIRLLVGRSTRLRASRQRQAFMPRPPGRMMSRHDPHGNILRTTVGAAAAGLGGADSVTILPFDSATAFLTGLPAASPATARSS